MEVSGGKFGGQSENLRAQLLHQRHPLRLYLCVCTSTPVSTRATYTPAGSDGPANRSVDHLRRFWEAEHVEGQYARSSMRYVRGSSPITPLAPAQPTTVKPTGSWSSMRRHSSSAAPSRC